MEKQLICWYWILDERPWGISKWELIEKGRKINIGKEQKVDSRSRLGGQVEMKIAFA